MQTIKVGRQETTFLAINIELNVLGLGYVLILTREIAAKSASKTLLHLYLQLA